MLFFRPGRFEPIAGKSEEWNRGAYLALGLSHCGACHTPRNLLGAEKAGDAYAGAVIDNWIAPPLTAANPAPAPWTREELYGYLRNGMSVLHGTAGGPDVARRAGLAALPELGRARRSQPISPTSTRRRTGCAASDPAVSARDVLRIARHRAGVRCRRASLHRRLRVLSLQRGHAPLATRPDLALNSAVNLPDPSNLIQVILRGISAEEGMPGVVMPSVRVGAQRCRRRPHCRVSPAHAHELSALARPRHEDRGDAPADQRLAIRSRQSEY